jgi:hypothetical protein
MRKVMKKIFVGTWKWFWMYFSRGKILGDISVEYLGSISGKNHRGSLGKYPGSISGKNLRVITGEISR